MSEKRPKNPEEDILSLEYPWKHKGPKIMVGPFFLLLLFGLALPFLSGYVPVVRFTEEQIDIQVHPDHIIVEGYYVYQNPHLFPVIQGFSIPLPVDQQHPMPVMVSAKILSPPERPVPTPYILGKHRFETKFGPREQIRIKVRYRQQVQRENARYLLVTTRPWRRPLVRGTYRLIPNGIHVTTSNYELQRDPSGMLVFRRHHFMPQQDWHFAWEVM